MEHRSIQLMTEARRALAEAASIDDVKVVMGRAEVARVLAKKAHLGRAAQNEAAEIAVRAQRLAGQMIREGQDAGEIAGLGKQNKDTTMVSLSDLDVTANQSSRWQQIASVPEDDFEDYFNTAKEDGVEITAAGARRLGKGRDLSPLMSSNSDEWYTTADIIDRVVRVMGAIDLDPCSNSHEDPNVPAAKHYTKDDDGLDLDWVGRVYMNPPYGLAIPNWVEKLLSEYAAGRLTEAVVLVPARTDTRWFRMLRDFPRCFMFGRVRFNGHVNSAPFPTMLVGIGVDREKFLAVTGEMGDVYERIGE